MRAFSISLQQILKLLSLAGLLYQGGSFLMAYTTQYIGSRYVPMFADPAEWDSARTYEPLTIVMHDGNSYTSRQYVPAGINITDKKFWALTGNYNAQIEAYRQEVAAIDARTTENTNNINTILPMDTTPTEGSTKAATSGGIYSYISNHIIVTPEMYGAAGDGNTDDTAAFEKASGKNIILYCKNSYAINASINNITIIGGKFKPFSNENPLFTIGNNTIIIDSIFMGLNSTTTQNDGLLVNEASNIVIENCTFTNFQRTVINITNSNNVAITNNTISSNGNESLNATPTYIFGSNNISIRDTIYKNNSGEGLLCFNSNYLSFDSISISNKSGAKGSATTVDNCTFVTYINVNIDTSTNSGIEVNASTYVNIKSCDVKKCDAYDLLIAPITSYGTKHQSIVNVFNSQFGKININSSSVYFDTVTYDSYNYALTENYTCTIKLKSNKNESITASNGTLHVYCNEPIYRYGTSLSRIIQHGIIVSKFNIEAGTSTTINMPYRCKVNILSNFTNDFSQHGAIEGFINANIYNQISSEGTRNPTVAINYGIATLTAKDVDLSGFIIATC